MKKPDNIKFYEDVLKKNLKKYGDEDSNVSGAYRNLGKAWEGIGNDDKAIEYYEKALKISFKVFGGNHPITKLDLKSFKIALWQLFRKELKNHKPDNENEEFNRWLLLNIR